MTWYDCALQWSDAFYKLICSLSGDDFGETEDSRLFLILVMLSWCTLSKLSQCGRGRDEAEVAHTQPSNLEISAKLTGTRMLYLSSIQ